ncbi:MAG: hydantoinase/oxoprolinase family protein [Acidobacteria bacterium]|nr:hydantoinase/oxoprolinase family protein [Acidobacteriota bacterium]
MSAFRVGVDIGGTFTDIVFLDPEGRIHTKKISSSVDDYARAIVDGLCQVFRETGLTGADVGEILHGTTVASNTILELQGARTGLITTKGFRDVLEIRRLRMPRLYDLTWEKPIALVERYLRVEVSERVNARGGVVTPLDIADAERAVDRLLAEHVEAIAVCLLNSYANPVHEERIKEIVRRRNPDLPLCISADVQPAIREYERTSTTVINTYVMPVVRAYLEALGADLERIGVKAPVLIMQSNGGLMTAEAAARMPVHIIESGPAAGVVGVQFLARRMGLSKAITFDMGGTTAKASIVEDGEVSRAGEYQVGGGMMHGSRLLTGAGYLIRVPAIDLAEVGAGGGSLVWIDAGGSLQVGPRSAGAFPGPLCYDLGGTEPTITDASLVLGYLNPLQLVGGAVKLNAARSLEVFEKRIATPLRLPLEEAAHGAHVIAASNMMRAIRAVSSERGRDPREYALFAFGGNGPLFAARIAQSLEIRRIVVPPSPGLFSAFGLLYSDVEHHYVRTWWHGTRQLDLNVLNEVWSRMETQALAQLAAEGFTGHAARIRRSADVRYQGQSYELTIPVRPGTVDAQGVAELEEAFAQEHELTYGHRAGPDEPVEIVSLRVVGQGIPEWPRVPGKIQVARGQAQAAGPRQRRVCFGPDTGWLNTPILGRADLAIARSGPCIVEEYDSTCLIPPLASGVLDEFGNIVIAVQNEESTRRESSRWPETAICLGGSGTAGEAPRVPGV